MANHDNPQTRKRLEKGKKMGGRPTKYKPEHCDTVVMAAEVGSSVTDEEIAKWFGVSEQAVKNWYQQYPEFIASVKRAKAISDDKVERSLFERATGYSVPDVHVGAKGQITPIIKHYPPDPVSMIFWLKNRRPERWRDKTELEHSGTINLSVTDYQNAESVDFNPDGSRKS